MPRPGDVTPEMMAKWDSEMEADPMDIVRTMKSILTIELFKRFPSFKRFYSRAGSLWSSGKFVSTVGKVSEATILRYIQEQKGQK